MNVIGAVIAGLVGTLAMSLVMGGGPAMHARVKAGTVQAPGVYMLNPSGLMAFMGGLIGHLVFGLFVALVYGLLV